MSIIITINVEDKFISYKLTIKWIKKQISLLNKIKYPYKIINFLFKEINYFNCVKSFDFNDSMKGVIEMRA